MKTLWIFVFLFLFSTTARSQFSVSGALIHMADDNIDNNAYQLSDRVTTFLLDAGYSWGEESVLDITYSGAFQHFARYTDHSATLHQLSLSYFPSLTEDESTTLEAAITASRRYGRESYTIYDNIAYNGQLQLEHTWGEIAQSKLLYSFTSIHFPNLENFDAYEHFVQAQTSLFFPTRTTVIVRGQVGAKIYEPLTYTRTDTIIITPTPPGQGHGTGGTSPSITTRTTRITGSSATSSQVKVFLRVAQGITTTTGIAVTGEYQGNLKKETRYFVTTDGSVPDDELFDNPYGYEGFFWSGMLTHKLPFDIVTRCSYSQQRRTYSALPAYDAAGTIINEHRIDTRRVATLSLEKEFDILTLSVVYDYIDTISNDPLYDTVNHAFTVSCAVAF